MLYKFDKSPVFIMLYLAINSYQYSHQTIFSVNTNFCIHSCIRSEVHFWLYASVVKVPYLTLWKPLLWPH